MVISTVTLVTLIDDYRNLPGRTRDAESSIWNFLIKQCLHYAENGVAIPVIARSADLCRFARPILKLPRAHRPIVRTNSPLGAGKKGKGRAGTRDYAIVRLFEDQEGTSTEWQDVISGYQYLESMPIQQQPYDLWIIGAADICKDAINLLPIPKRLFSLKVPGKWSGNPWRLPNSLQVLLESTWVPLMESEREKQDFNASEISCYYAVITHLHCLNPLHPSYNNSPNNDWRCGKCIWDFICHKKSTDDDWITDAKYSLPLISETILSRL